MDKRPKQNDREIALRKYFEVVTRERTTILIVMIAAGIVFALVGLALLSSPDGAAMAWFCIVTGSGIAAVGGLRLGSIEARYRSALAATQPQPSDSQVDAWFQDSRQHLILHAKNRLNLFGAESDFFKPLIIEVPTLSATYGVPTEDLKWRKGSDGTFRFAIHHLIVIYLTERHLAAFTCDFNFIRDVSLNETTREYHYLDIVSVATYEYSQAFTLPTGEKLSTSQTFRLSVGSGEYIEVKLENDQLRKMTQQEEVPTFEADQAVTTIRAMLRDRKALAA
ncbi:MAG: hypothetical protein JF614_08940 [Acidobacteria bacterium]|nr:hypothetical protein [Acidobacteriota bacterium]